jgi:glucokinase
MTMLLVGDIGGTKTSLALYSGEHGPFGPAAEATYPSAQYTGLDVMVRDFLSEIGGAADSACFGVAGPVVEGRATITNLPWVLDESELAAALGTPSVRLLNDLTAIACALPFLSSEELHTLNAGDPAPKGALAVIAPGTGLGEAFLTWDGARYLPQPSEGGHASFAPVSSTQVELLRYLFGRFAHVSSERVCSGSGIPNIYAFLRDSGQAPEPAWLAMQIAAAPDPTPVIVRAALETPQPDALCMATLETFVTILGAEAGNLALKVLATGGVYLGGGIPPRLLRLLEHPAFLETFRGKGRMADLLDRVPVHVILNPKAALLGAACWGFGLIGD